jgi:uncharacterized protein (TIGR00369 family)
MSDRPSADRSFHMTWDDPVAAAAHGLALGGLAYLQGILRGEFPQPPICLLVGFRFTEAAAGRVVMTFDPSERLYNPLGVVHGGAAATVLDSVMGCAVHSTLAPGRAYTTLEIKINYLRAMTGQTGPVRAEGTVVHAGRSTAMAEGRLLDGAGRVCAAGSTTCLLFDLPPAKG